MPNTPHGSNVKKLLLARMSALLIPPDTADPLVASIRALQSSGCLRDAYKEAEQWTHAALAAIKSAPDNTYGTDDEVIAGMLLQRIATTVIERKQGKSFG